ncbi:MAG: hypothetical protein LAT77_04825 [Aliidiomarina sp.]|uniref:hypothetical protein n=1 Tax=Aliidiomarina sp. TaxID=1872439 RepID=UPI0025BF95B7|nr:hypothetical protein [Aliidiomarina sp.]MCH8501223.1 hypothetical protein [Aliidiomarina sp.]
MPDQHGLPHRRLGQKVDDTKTNQGRRLIILLLSLMIIGLLTRVFLQHLWLPERGGWKDAEFNAAVHRFQSHVMLAHVEWIRHGEPRYVQLESSDGTSLQIKMNAAGWPEVARVSDDPQNPCELVWLQLAELGQLRQQLSAEVILAEDEGRVAECWFYYGSELRFRYRVGNGQVQHELQQGY